ncbi:mannose-1-phosphate guanylyltransferase/mannose-6-phosphate isomerase [Gynuella sunshinyii]|uniref:mannose-1-phosphate guanylyltransferase n=1 Tax=Gynuella sunshinyii YC6258 TaxID=1445510 RepID=A0A0C5VY50_9GAMM|nr:mannose-1-phosphate guanylyltransferase/mannose-6-phosphate isomerase [Gynuella sunshinyii]AJQ95294.1 mannose-1-phosphate guanylyltransferase [Gynuella sunshinyii YC6258]
MILPVIMAGGSGTRLWPLSRQLFPKQFNNLAGEYTMLQETAMRLSGLDIEKPLTICNEEHRFIVAEQLRDIDRLGQIILEPEGRNTAPAIALAALAAVSRDKDSVLLVLAADHVIKDVQAFHGAVKSAAALALEGDLITFGIVPTEAHTGYGYIRRGQAKADGFKVEQFVEKPNVQTAEEYIKSGEYLWNSGMFMFKAEQYLDELKAHRPDIFQACAEAVQHTSVDLDFVRVDADAFRKCPDESVDYAVMENTGRAMVIPMDAGWSDVGSWSSLWEINEKDDAGNVFHGDVVNLDSHNCLVQGEDRLVATLGLDDIVIVDTKDALLVAAKNRVQEVKDVVAKIKAEGRSHYHSHREVYRPWGKYDSIDSGARYQVKRITVKPGCKLSVQMHHHRAEHWIVVSGTAKVTNGDKTFLVTENQSTYIPVGEVHALENPGSIPLELIEVQSGSYLGEDDIVRFEDRYGRT